MRRFAILVTATLFAAGVAACGSSSKPESSNTTTTVAGGTTSPTTSPGSSALAKIDCDGKSAYVTDIGNVADFKPVTSDTLTIVTSLPGPGFFTGSDTDPAKITGGYEYEIAKKLQEAFGLHNLVIRNENFDAIVAGTVTKYDISFSQVTITCDRAKVVQFSVPYFDSTQGALMKTGGTLATLEDAKKIQWGVQTSTTAIDVLKAIGTDKDPKVFQQLSDAYTALQAGQIDSVLIDTSINLREAAESNGKFTVVAQFQTKEGPDHYGAILPKDSTNVGAVNAALEQLRSSGELTTLAADSHVGTKTELPSINVP